MLWPRPSALDRAAFIDAYGGVYEHSPWAAAGAFDAGLGAGDDEAGALAGRMAQVVDAADDAAKLALLRAHPELARRLAVSGELTAESTAEQASAGLDRCTPEEFAEFHTLNEQYNAPLRLSLHRRRARLEPAGYSLGFQRTRRQRPGDGVRHRAAAGPPHRPPAAGSDGRVAGLAVQRDRFAKRDRRTAPLCPLHEGPERRHQLLGRFFGQEMPAVLEFKQLEIGKPGRPPVELLLPERDVLVAPEQ